MKSRLVLLSLFAVLLISGCAGKEEVSPEPTLDPAATPTLSLQERTFEALWSVVNENYVYDDFHGVDWQAVHDEHLPEAKAGLDDEEFAEVVRDMLVAFPPGAVLWQSRSERIEQDIQDRSSYEGIGAYVAFREQPEPRVVLMSVMPNSPAEKAGLQAHDSILAIGGVPVQADEGLRGAVERIRGPAESQVTLNVRSPGAPPRDVVVTRARLAEGDRLRLGFVPGSAVGYLLFPPTSYDELADDVIRSLQVLTNTRPMDGLLLDLRVASVGRDWPREALLTLFADGELGEFYTRTQTETLTIEGQDFLNSQDLPLAVLVGPDTVGFSEIFAAAVQSTGRAKVVGRPTPGFVEGAAEFSLPNGSRVFVDTISYRTPDGREIGLTGIEPDIIVDVDWDAVTSKDDPVRDAALETIRASSG